MEFMLPCCVAYTCITLEDDVIACLDSLPMVAFWQNTL
jgi:hypothetical protein